MTRYKTIFTMRPDGTCSLTDPMPETRPFDVDSEALLVICFFAGPPDLLMDIAMRTAYDLSLVTEDAMNSFRRHIDMEYAARCTGMLLISHKGTPRNIPEAAQTADDVQAKKMQRKNQKKTQAESLSLDFSAEL